MPEFKTPLGKCLARVASSEKAARSVFSRVGPDLPVPELERAFFNFLENPEASPLLADVPGLARSSRERLLASFELARRYAAHRESRLRARAPAFSSDPRSASLARIPETLRCETREWLGFVPCYRRRRLGELCVIERGVRTHVNIDPADLFSRILALRPEGFTLFHNHPSGDLTPSPADFDLTNRIDRVSRQLGIRLLDHGIVSASGEVWIQNPRAML